MKALFEKNRKNESPIFPEFWEPQIRKNWSRPTFLLNIPGRSVVYLLRRTVNQLRDVGVLHLQRGSLEATPEAGIHLTDEHLFHPQGLILRDEYSLQNLLDLSSIAGAQIQIFHSDSLFGNYSKSSPYSPSFCT